MTVPSRSGRTHGASVGLKLLCDAYALQQRPVHEKWPLET